ncbi:MAG: glycoside hydrolase family 5 protein [Candidatus Bathyarchaeia archaeon]|nr:glycoside hydrolase family 5 protein [Candidatus Bathyarchaeota archaeon]
MGSSDIFRMNQMIGRGVNVLGYDPIWKNRLKARMNDKHFKLIKQAGFNSVRINLHPFRDMGIDDKNRMTKRWLETLDWAIEQSLSNGLVTILDFHEFGVMGEDPMGNKEKFLAVWRNLGEHCKDCPDKVVFEILNEPNKQLTPELWNQFFVEALAIIRESNPSRAVIVGPGNWNNIDSLGDLVLPEDDRKIIVTVHYYRPMEFTHQGASWVGLKDKTGVEWKASAEEKQAIINDFEKAQAWAKNHDRPLFLGEFGAYDKADMDSRVRYIGFVARQAEKLSWSWAYWQFDSDFIVYDIQNDKWVTPILNALIPSKK